MLWTRTMYFDVIAFGYIRPLYVIVSCYICGRTYEYVAIFVSMCVCANEGVTWQLQTALCWRFCTVHCWLCGTCGRCNNTGIDKSIVWHLNLNCLQGKYQSDCLAEWRKHRTLNVPLAIKPVGMHTYAYVYVPVWTCIYMHALYANISTEVSQLISFLSLLCLLCCFSPSSSFLTIMCVCVCVCILPFICCMLHYIYLHVYNCYFFTVAASCFMLHVSSV